MCPITWEGSFVFVSVSVAASVLPSTHLSRHDGCPWAVSVCFLRLTSVSTMSPAPLCPHSWLRTTESVVMEAPWLKLGFNHCLFRGKERQVLFFPESGGSLKNALQFPQICFVIYLVISLSVKRYGNGKSTIGERRVLKTWDKSNHREYISESYFTEVMFNLSQHSVVGTMWTQTPDSLAGFTISLLFILSSPLSPACFGLFLPSDLHILFCPFTASPHSSELKSGLVFHIAFQVLVFAFSR